MAKRHGPSEAEYFELEAGPNEVQINVQRVTHPSRVHLDIETDDVEPEVRSPASRVRSDSCGPTGRCGSIEGQSTISRIARLS